VQRLRLRERPSTGSIEIIRTKPSLDALLTCAPAPEGRRRIALDFVAKNDWETGLDKLAEFYKAGLLLSPS